MDLSKEVETKSSQNSNRGVLRLIFRKSEKVVSSEEFSILVQKEKIVFLEDSLKA